MEHSMPEEVSAEWQQPFLWERLADNVNDDPRQSRWVCDDEFQLRVEM